MIKMRILVKHFCLTQLAIAATKSAALAIDGAKLVREGKDYVFAICRPPGHHAGINMYGGYCYFNNVWDWVIDANALILSLAQIFFFFLFSKIGWRWCILASSYFEVALAAEELKSNGLVCILDIDYHHGNGTQVSIDKNGFIRIGFMNSFFS